MDKKQTSINEDQLVLMHKRARTKKKKKTILTLVLVLTITLVVIAATVLLLRRSIQMSVASSGDNEVQSAEVYIGSISTTVSASGTLESEEVEILEVIRSLEIIDYYAEIGDKVEKGDLIATVTNASLLTSLSEKQGELDALDEKINEVSQNEVSDTIAVGVAGRVKKIFAEEGEDVATAMYDHGSLMMLSLDGYLFIEVAEDTLKTGDSVNVVLSDDTSVKGLVEKQINGTATILVSDEEAAYEEFVTVYSLEDQEIGTGTLSIHSQLAISGYAGTISSIFVAENEEVSAGETLMSLTDTESSANYDTLLKEREAVEEELNDLIRIYKEGGICAPISGTVDNIGESTISDTVTDAASMIQESTTGTTGDVAEVATISADTNMVITISVDETDILSLVEGQEASVSIDSIGEDIFAGTVTEVNTIASSDSGVTTYSAVITLEKTESMLAGMSASVVITIEGNDNAMLIPTDALHKTSSSAYVYTEYDEGTGEFSGMKEVTIGLSNSSYVEITEGLSEGDLVYYTTAEDNSPFGNMSGFGNMRGEMPNMENMPGGGMPDFRGGSMPGGENGFGGNMPSGRSEN